MAMKTLLNQNGLEIFINHKNELVVDIAKDAVIPLFVKAHNRPPKSENEAVTYLHRVITKQLKKHGYA